MEAAVKWRHEPGSGMIVGAACCRCGGHSELGQRVLTQPHLCEKANHHLPMAKEEHNEIWQLALESHEGDFEAAKPRVVDALMRKLHSL